MKHSVWITILVVIGVIGIALIILFVKGSNNPPLINENTSVCIGENSVLYVQLGCNHCELQENLFKENVRHLNIVDCFDKVDECKGVGIMRVPSWEINGTLYSGFKSPEQLKNLTGCYDK